MSQCHMKSASQRCQSNKVWSVGASKNQSSSAETTSSLSRDESGRGSERKIHLEFVCDCVGSMQLKGKDVPEIKMKA
jgi:hypothetical protein